MTRSHSTLKGESMTHLNRDPPVDNPTQSPKKSKRVDAPMHSLSAGAGSTASAKVVIMPGFVVQPGAAHQAENAGCAAATSPGSTAVIHPTRCAQASCTFLAKGSKLQPPKTMRSLLQKRRLEQRLLAQLHKHLQRLSPELRREVIMQRLSQVQRLALERVSPQRKFSCIFSPRLCRFGWTVP